MVSRLDELDRRLLSMRDRHTRVQHIEQKFGEIMDLWTTYFKPNAQGYEPVYFPMFETGAAQHETTAEGVRLHKEYNT